MPTRAAPVMSINRPDAYRRLDEIALMGELVPMAGLKVLELGCGAAWTTRLLVERLGAESVVATEVDRIQHEKNLGLTDLPRVTFRYGGAERIDDPDGTYDLVVMLKSLAPCSGAPDGPGARRDPSRAQARRSALLLRACLLGAVQRPDASDRGRARGARARLRRLQSAVERGLFELEQEIFFESEGIYPDWPGFESRFVDVTHSERRIGPERRAEIRAAFESHLTPSGARFLKPHRVDLLRKREQA